MTITQLLKEKNITIADVEICIYDMSGMCPYDDTDLNKYLNAECEKIEYDEDDFYTIDCFFSDEIIYQKN